MSTNNSNRKAFNQIIYMHRVSHPVILLLYLLCIVIGFIYLPETTITYIYLAGIIILFSLTLAIRISILRRKSELGKEIDDFFERYNLNPDKNDSSLIDSKLAEIGNINSQFPDKDKKMARALLEFKKSLNN